MGGWRLSLNERKVTFGLPGRFKYRVEAGLVVRTMVQSSSRYTHRRPQEAMLPESLNKKSPNFWKPQKTYIKAILKSQKTYIKGLLKVKNIYIKALKIMQKTSLNSFFWLFLKSSPKRSQILKSPNQKTDRQMVLKVAQMVINHQIWQHCQEGSLRFFTIFLLFTLLGEVARFACR